ncbi:hypothetical protein R3P38DRAFT_2517739, partial [Favolaschia claudopus]
MSASYQPTLCGLPISVTFDTTASKSSVSLDWVMQYGLRTQGSLLSGPLFLASTLELSLPIPLSDVHVVSSLSCDLVLGLDWFRSVSSFPPDTVFHLSSGPLLCINCRRLPVSPPDPLTLRGTECSPFSPVPVGGPGVVLTPSSGPRTLGPGVVPAT